MAKKLEDLTTIDDLIEFYKAIPEEKWCTGKFQDDKGNCCALGHLGRGIAIQTKQFLAILLTWYILLETDTMQSIFPVLTMER